MSVHVSTVQVSAGKGRSVQVSAGQCRSVQERAGQGRSAQVSALNILPLHVYQVSVMPTLQYPSCQHLAVQALIYIVNPMHWRYGYQFVEFVSYRIYKF